MELIVGEFDHAPPFMAFEPLPAGRNWLLLVWLPCWILNIPVEEAISFGLI